MQMIPLKIYKYTPLNLNVIRLLITSKLYLAKFSALNDPFEGEFNLKKLDKEPDYESVKYIFKEKNLDTKKITEEFFYQYIKDMLIEYIDQYYGVSCFSEINDNILMWSHYADSHRGICLEFDSEKLIQSQHMRMNDLSLEKINIIEGIPIVDFTIDKDELKFNNQKNLLISKFKPWEYEKEVRIYGFLGSVLNGNKLYRNLAFDPKSLTSIIIGANTTQDDIDLLALLVHNHNKLQHIKWYRAKKDNLQVGLRIEECKFFIPDELTIKPQENNSI